MDNLFDNYFIFQQPVRLYIKGTILGFKRYVVIFVIFTTWSIVSSTSVSLCYHRGRRNTYHHTNLLQLEGVNDKAASNFYLGKKIAYIYKATKAVSGSKFRVVWGKVMRCHGTNGVVRAKFSTNLSVSLSYYV